MHEFEEKTREQAPFLKRDAAVVFFDIGNFKAFNMNRGRHEGDVLLRFVGSTLERVFENRFCARLGDDHFAVFCFEDEIEAGLTAVNEIIVESYPEDHVMIKAGISAYRKDTDIMTICDEARAACESIRNTYDRFSVRYDESMRRTMLTRAYVIDHVEDAIERGWIRIYYQPVVRAMTGRMASVEALARWEDPSFGRLHPDQFVPVLEEVRRIHLLDLYMAELACRDIQSILKEGKEPLPVSINLSRLDFQLCDIVKEINSLTRKYGVDHSLIEIEITERTLSTDNGVLGAALNRFHADGYDVWMDDFGSEYSSFNALKDYDFNVLKIDMKFLSRMNEEDRKTPVILHSIIDMAKQLGIHTLCEGVETKESFDFLKDAGCELIQGYYFARPCLKEDLFNLDLTWEKAQDRSYMEKVGMVNLLSPDPLHGGTHGASAMALFEGNETGFKCLGRNETFNEFLRNIGMEPNRPDEVFARIGKKFFHQIQDAAVRSFDRKKAVSLDLVLNGDYTTMSITGVSRNRYDGTYVIFIKALDLSKIGGFVNTDLRENVLRSLYSMFERIDLLSPDTDSVQTIYRNTAMYQGFTDGSSIHQAVTEFASNNVYPQDQARFVEFFDMAKAGQEIHESGERYRSNLFRVIDQNGNYRVQLCLMIDAKVDGKDRIVVCAGDADPLLIRAGTSLFEQIADQNGTPDLQTEMARHERGHVNNPIMRSLLDMADIGIFWKDKQRRFVGANRYFREYYGFSSDADFIGKTDEEMGWHVNPDPFRNDEYRVIQYGENVRGAEGTCISHGQNRFIRAWKAPVIRDGETIGLVGYFMDVTHDSRNESEWLRSIETDSLTGLLDVHGMRHVFSQYQESFDVRGINFALIYVDIQNFEEFNREYGYSKANEILKLAAERIQEAAGTASSIGRLDADQFLLLHQFSERSEVDALCARIGLTTGRAARIAGTDQHLNLLIDHIYYSDLAEDDRRALYERGLRLRRNEDDRKQ